METERKTSYRQNRNSSQDYEDENAADIEDADLIETDMRKEEVISSSHASQKKGLNKSKGKHKRNPSNKINNSYKEDINIKQEVSPISKEKKFHFKIGGNK